MSTSNTKIPDDPPRSNAIVPRLNSEDNKSTDTLTRVFPTEIISQIFLQTVPPFRPHRGSAFDTTLPLALGSICRSWRVIAWATPELWSSLTLDFMKNKRDDIDGVLLACNGWLSRAGITPLSIRFIAPRNIHFGTPKAQKIISFLSMHLPQCYHLDIRIPFSLVLTLTDLYKSSFQSLRSLYIQCTAQDVRGTWHLKGFIADTALKLTDLTLSYIYLQRIAFPWSTLTSLDLHQIFLYELIAVSEQAHNLIHLSIQNIVPAPSSGPDEALTLRNTAYLPKLQTLHWVQRSILDEVEFPAYLLESSELRHFRVLSKVNPVGMRHISKIVKNSASTLKTIILNDSYQEESIFELWALSPSISLIQVVNNMASDFYPVLSDDHVGCYQHGGKLHNEVVLFLPSICTNDVSFATNSD